MTIEEIKDILQLLVESGVAEIEVQRGDNRVWIKRSVGAADAQAALAGAPAASVSIAQPATSSTSAPTSVATNVTTAAPAAEEQLPAVKAPIVGTFYESPSPGAAPFIKVGDTVQAGQVLCIIESMKLMNEIEAEAAGVIVSKLVPNGKPVEYGESLFLYRPL